jgi:hypothetical protein
MKLVKNASGKKTIKISKKEWENLGKKAGWIKSAMPLMMDAKVRKIDTVEGMLSLKDICPNIDACQEEVFAKQYLESGPFYLITDFGKPIIMCHPGTDGYYDMDAREVVEDKEWCKRLISESEEGLNLNEDDNLDRDSFGSGNPSRPPRANDWQYSEGFWD